VEVRRRGAPVRDVDIAGHIAEDLPPGERVRLEAVADPVRRLARAGLPVNGGVIGDIRGRIAARIGAPVTHAAIGARAGA
jgi:hypothetical protein